MSEMLTEAMPKTFDHRLVEEKLYERWLQSGAFTPAIDPSQKPFTIVIPPPNVNRGSASLTLATILTT